MKVASRVSRSGSIWKAVTWLTALCIGVGLATAGRAEDKAAPATGAGSIGLGDSTPTVILPETGEKIVYDPVSKSYFQLHGFTAAESKDPRRVGDWLSAQSIASSLTFKGVPGRLAIVKTPEVHDFLLRTFRSFNRDDAWIGMKVDCKSMKAYWTDGTPVDQQSFSAWDLGRWYRTDINCMNNPALGWMGVYYKPANAGFRWQASGPAKAFEYMFIEYPTGKP